jgi:hypothetical protein
MTTLAEATKTVESMLGHRGGKRDPELRDNVQDVCSGGIRQKGGVHPALYASEEDAIDAWRRAAQALAEDYHSDFSPLRFNWIEKPDLRRFQMTMADLKSQHRVVTDRFAVESRIAIAK